MVPSHPHSALKQASSQASFCCLAGSQPAEHQPGGSGEPSVLVHANVKPAARFEKSVLKTTSMEPPDEVTGSGEMEPLRPPTGVSRGASVAAPS